MSRLGVGLAVANKVKLHVQVRHKGKQSLRSRVTFPKPFDLTGEKNIFLRFEIRREIEEA